MSVDNPSGKLKYQCVAFDAVGTLIHATPSVPKAYHSIGHRYGCRLELGEIQRRFQDVFSKRQLSETTSEEEEFQYWRRIVGEVIGEVEQADACFEELYNHFAKPESWSVSPHADETIQQLQLAGVQVAVASNFDVRLHSVFDGHPGLKDISIRIISSEIGWRKPNLKFYESLISRANCLPSQILMIGDDLQNDVLAAQDAGLAALHYVPGNVGHQNETDEYATQIRSLDQLRPQFLYYLGK
ncbi:MAG: HAD-IA family hydrolase [Planctomicrobium sp.]|nr:HAD-IA family hydrolase [Planctomicrobium sp.]